jgi:predicted aspartyl protease
MRCLFSIAVATSFLAAALPASAANNCRLAEAASVNMTVDSSGRITVPMTIGGKPARMMVDTGSPLSLITYNEARDLNLDIKHADVGAAGTATITMFGDLTVALYTKAPDVAIGQLKAESMGFGIFPGTSELDENDGILGDDVMRNYDVDFDFAGGKFNLFSKDHCSGAVVYWTSSPVAVVPFSRNPWGHILLDVQLDGKNVRAMLDTGASRTAGNWLPLRHYFGINEKSAGMIVKGDPDQGSDTYRYPFKTLTFGGVTVTNPDIVMFPRSLQGDNGNAPDLILGINILRQLHLYIAEGEERLYITPASAH